MATSTTNALSISTLLDAKATPRQPPSASPQCASLPTLPPRLVQSKTRLSKTTAYCRKMARNVMVMATTEEASSATTTEEAPAAIIVEEVPATEEAPAAIFIEEIPATEEAPATILVEEVPATEEAPAAILVEEVPATEEAPAAITIEEAPAATIAEEAPTITAPEPQSEPELQPVVTPITTETPTADPSDILKTIQEAWDKVEDKYGVSSLAVAGFVALWGTSGMISAIDRLPLVPGVLELVGIGYSGWFAYKNLITKTSRDALILKIKSTYKDIIGSS